MVVKVDIQIVSSDPPKNSSSREYRDWAEGAVYAVEADFKSDLFSFCFPRSSSSPVQPSV
jgi:hypothetical protein